MHRQTQTQTKSHSSFNTTKITPSSPTKFHINKQPPQPDTLSLPLDGLTGNGCRWSSPAATPPPLLRFPIDGSHHQMVVAYGGGYKDRERERDRERREKMESGGARRSSSGADNNN
ncbi:hypothetical protein HanPI659440_Chr02g0044911 [Helianthus annuus]|nr:hypothetical protein HanPI659440_Chr02g0044911 [Helianthus annuus]